VQGNRELKISPNLKTGTRDMKKEKTFERINNRKWKSTKISKCA